MYAAITHLPGCDLNHKTRQRCSTWVEPVTRQNEPIGSSSSNTDVPSGVAFNVFAVVGLVLTVILIAVAISQDASSTNPSYVHPLWFGFLVVVLWLLLSPLLLVSLGAVFVHDPAFLRPEVSVKKIRVGIAAIVLAGLVAFSGILVASLMQGSTAGA